MKSLKPLSKDFLYGDPDDINNSHPVIGMEGNGRVGHRACLPYGCDKQACAEVNDEKPA